MAENEKSKDSGLLDRLKDQAKWWLGWLPGDRVSEAAEDVDRDTRARRIRCIEEGGTWDPDQRKCVK